jgi:carboxyl-terminal processing protease
MKKPSERYQEYGRSLLVGALVGLTLALVFGAGFFLRDIIDMPPVFAQPISSRSGSNAEQSEDYQLLREVQSLLDRHYLREQPEYTTRQYAAIRGMLGALNDRGTYFNEPVVARSESDVLAGTYGGIGVELQRDAAGRFVLYPFPEGPAAEAGIGDGDVLYAVNGDPVGIETHQDVVDQMLRGEVKDDNGVEITVLRADDEEFTAFILFDVINVPSVLWRLLAQDERVGYIQLLRFTNRTPSEMVEALELMYAEDVAALVLDLRNNSGGLLQESIDVASIFLDGGVVLYEETAQGERTFEAEGGGEAVDIPLVVLVNGGTASAAELVAGAIQDRQRGTLIGQNTFGKGTIQQIFPLADQSSIHVTSAEWFTPDRNRLDGVGLQPNILMIPDEAGRDIEIEEAVRHLQEELVTQGAAQ